LVSSLDTCLGILLYSKSNTELYVEDVIVSCVVSFRSDSVFSNFSFLSLFCQVSGSLGFSGLLPILATMSLPTAIETEPRQSLWIAKSANRHKPTQTTELKSTGITAVTLWVAIIVTIVMMLFYVVKLLTG
jgi:hypothetical protein